MLQKTETDFELTTDFVKMTTGIETGGIANGDEITFQKKEGYRVNDDYTMADANDSAPILVYPPSLLKRVLNKPTDFDSNGQPIAGVIFDHHPNPASVFYGVFQIEFGINDAFNSGATVDIYARKPEEASFKKIASMTANNKPTDGSPWVERYYWDARTPGEEWDGAAYKTTGTMQFRFVVR